MSKSSRIEKIRSWLANEGYAPKIDGDGDIVIKIEGGTYCVILEDGDEEFYRLVYPSFWSIDSETERQQVVRAAEAATGKTKVAKVFVVKQNTWASIELFLSSADEFNRTFRRSVSALQASIRNFREAMAG